jgi:hypothetical protein
MLSGGIDWFYDRCLVLIANQTIDQAFVRLGWHRSHRLYYTMLF